MTCCIECVTISLCTTICDICWDFVRDEPCLLSLLCKNHGVKSDFCQKLAALKTQSKCFCISTATQIRGISKSFQECPKNIGHYTTDINNTEKTENLKKIRQAILGSVWVFIVLFEQRHEFFILINP